MKRNILCKAGQWRAYDRQTNGLVTASTTNLFPTVVIIDRVTAKPVVVSGLTATLGQMATVRAAGGNIRWSPIGRTRS